MSIEPNSSMKTCPTCGTRVSEGAPRCLVCGTPFTQPQARKSRQAKQASRAEIQGPRMPTITLSIPMILIALILFIGIGGGLTYTALNLTGGIYVPTDEPTPTHTLAPTGTSTPSTPGCDSGWRSEPVSCCPTVRPRGSRPTGAGRSGS